MSRPQRWLRLSYRYLIVPVTLLLLNSSQTWLRLLAVCGRAASSGSTAAARLWQGYLLLLCWLHQLARSGLARGRVRNRGSVRAESALTVHRPQRALSRCWWRAFARARRARSAPRSDSSSPRPPSPFPIVAPAAATSAAALFLASTSHQQAQAECPGQETLSIGHDSATSRLPSVELSAGNRLSAAPTRFRKFVKSSSNE